MMEIDKSDKRRICPKCGEDRRNMIHESVDKEIIIHDYPKMYGKKYKCGKCGQEWRER